VVTFSNLRKGVQLFIILYPFIQPYVIISVGKLNLSLQLGSAVLMTAFLLYKFIFGNKAYFALNENVNNRSVFFLVLLLLLTVVGNTGVIGTNSVNFILLLSRKISFIYLGWVSFRTLKDGRNFVDKCLIIFSLLLIYGLNEMITHSNPILEYFQSLSKIVSDNILTYDSSIRGYRLQSVYYHSYAWGGILLIVSSVLLYRALNSKTQKASYLYLALYFAAMVNIIFTHARSCIAPAFLITGLLILLKSGGRSRKTGYFFPLVFLAVIILIFSPQVQNVIAPYFSFSEDDTSIRGSSSQMRFGQLVAALGYVKQSFFTGNGFEFSKSLLKDIGGFTELQGAESFWYVTIIDTGLIGVVAYLGFFTGIVRRFVLLRRRVSQATKTQINFIVVTIIGYFIFITLTGEMNTLSYFFICLGMASKLVYLQLNVGTKTQAVVRLNVNKPVLQ
jgi:hypothetical protein